MFGEKVCGIECLGRKSLFGVPPKKSRTFVFWVLYFSFKRFSTLDGLGLLRYYPVWARTHAQTHTHTHTMSVKVVQRNCASYSVLKFRCSFVTSTNVALTAALSLNSWVNVRIKETNAVLVQ